MLIAQFFSNLFKEIRKNIQVRSLSTKPPKLETEICWNKCFFVCLLVFSEQIVPMISLICMLYVCRYLISKSVVCR